MNSTEAKIGIRARFTAKDEVFHYGEREGKAGTIVADACGDQAGRFGTSSGGCCYWKIDGEDGVYITGLADLTAE